MMAVTWRFCRPPSSLTCKWESLIAAGVSYAGFCIKWSELSLRGEPSTMDGQQSFDWPIDCAGAAGGQRERRTDTSTFIGCRQPPIKRRLSVHRNPVRQLSFSAPRKIISFGFPSGMPGAGHLSPSIGSSDALSQHHSESG